MTLNSVIALILRYFAESILQADYVTFVEVRPQNIVFKLHVAKTDATRNAVSLRCLSYLYYMGAEFCTSSSVKHEVDVAWYHCLRENFIFIYCDTIPISLLVDQRKMIL